MRNPKGVLVLTYVTSTGETREAILREPDEDREAIRNALFNPQTIMRELGDGRFPKKTTDADVERFNEEHERWKSKRDRRDARTLKRN